MPVPRVASLNSRSQKRISEDFDVKVGKPSPKMGSKHNNIPFMPVRNARTKKMAKKVKDTEIEENYQEYQQDIAKPETYSNASSYYKREQIPGMPVNIHVVPNQMHYPSS